MRPASKLKSQKASAPPRPGPGLDPLTVRPLTAET